MKTKMRRRIIIALILSMFILLVADAAPEVHAWSPWILEDITEGEYLTKNLGMNQVTRQSVIRTIRENWTEGLKYGQTRYYGMSLSNPGPCVNYVDRQYEGNERSRCGYNCSGFVASVLYYANGGSKENALSNMENLYLPLKQGRTLGKQSSFVDSSGWYYYFTGVRYTPSGTMSVPKTKVYYLGQVSGGEDIQKAMNKAEKEGKLKEGYMVYFWPIYDTDCHASIYGGKDENGVHQIYHSIGRGWHNGVWVDADIALSPAISSNASYLYVVPMLEEENEYYLAVTAGSKRDGSRLNGLPVQVGVSTDKDGSSWTTVTAKTGYFTDLPTGKSVVTAANSPGGIRREKVTLGDLEIPAKDGVAWIRLGKYETPPKVIVREAWDKGLSIQLVGKDGKAIRASGSRGSEGVAWIPVQIDNKNRTLSGALGQAPDFRYSFNEKGVMQTGWQKIGKKWYYFRKDGVMAEKEFVNGFWLGKTGAGVSGFRAFWKKDAGGWKYGTASGWVVRNMTLTIDGKIYTFDARGYARRGK